VLSKHHRVVKLIDFGLSVIWRPDQALFKSYGTPCYTAPEIMSGQSYSGPKVDVWSLGVCLSTMLTGTLPFQAHCSNELKRRVMAGRYTLPDSMSPDAKDLIRQMLTLSPDRRISIVGIQQHRWLHRVARQQTDGSMHRGAADVSPDWENCPLDGAVLQQLEEYGLDPHAVERSVRAQAYNHESACYDMVAARLNADASTAALRFAKAS